MGFLESVGGFLQKALPIVSAIAKFVPGLQGVGAALSAVSKAFGAVNALTKKADESDEKADDVAEKAKAVTPGVAKAAAEFSKPAAQVSKLPETKVDINPVVAEKPPASIEQQKRVVQALQDKWAKTSEGTGAMGKDQIRRHVSTEFNVDKDLNAYRANHGGKDLTKEDLADMTKKLDAGIPISAQ